MIKMLEFYMATGIAVTIGLYVLSKTKKVCMEGKTLSLGISIGWWITDVAWTALVAFSSLYNIWPLEMGEMTALIAGLILLGVGCSLTLIGIIEFHSLRKISGMEVSNLITTGIYRWSRNPQFLGFYLALLGISFIGRSGYAFLLAIMAIVYCTIIL